MACDEAKKTFSARLWEENAELAEKSLTHPWVQGLAAGTITEESFAKYIWQDAYFLLAFARSYGRCIGKCKNIESVKTVHGLLGAVIDELTLHDSYASSFGKDPKFAEPLPATVAYTDFLDQVGNDPSTTSLDILAAMAPCMSLYAYIGKSLQRKLSQRAEPPRKRFTKEWIETYSSEDFHGAASQVEKFLDALRSDSDSDGRAPELYARAMQLEYDFFDAQER